MQRFKSVDQLQIVVTVHDQVTNLLHRCRYNVSTIQKRANRRPPFTAGERVSRTNTFSPQKA